MRDLVGMGGYMGMWVGARRPCHVYQIHNHDTLGAEVVIVAGAEVHEREWGANWGGVALSKCSMLIILIQTRRCKYTLKIVRAL